MNLSRRGGEDIRDEMLSETEGSKETYLGQGRRRAPKPSTGWTVEKRVENNAWILKQKIASDEQLHTHQHAHTDTLSNIHMNILVMFRNSWFSSSAIRLHGFHTLLKSEKPCVRKLFLPLGMSEVLSTAIRTPRRLPTCTQDQLAGLCRGWRFTVVTLAGCQVPISQTHVSLVLK